MRLLFSLSASAVLNLVPNPTLPSMVMYWKSVPGTFHLKKPVCCRTNTQYPRLEVCDELLCIYQYMMHPKQTIFFLEQELAASTKQAHTQDEATTHLALTIQQVLTCAVQYVDETDDSAECILLLLQEAVQRFRRLACVDDHLMGVEIQILQKRIRLVQQGNTYKGKQKDTSSLLGKDRPFHQQTLNMDLNDMLHRLESCSRAISPDTASTASDDRSEGSKQVMKHAGGLMFSRETAMLLAGSPDKQTSITTAISHYTSLKSHAKPRRPAHQGSIHFPALHRAILFGTEQEARSRLQSTERSLESADFFRRNIAHVAAEKGRIQLLENILPALRAKFDTRDCFNLTPLIITVMHGHLESCKLLIEAGFDRKARDSTGHNILSIAIKRRHVGIVEYLLKELDFPPSDSHGQYICSPIRDAIENGDLEICRLLIQCGADVVTPFNEKSPWTLASHKGLDLVAQYINEKIARDCGSDLDADGAPPQPHFPYGSMPPFQTVEVNDHRAPQHYFNSDQMHNMTSYVPNAPFYQPHSTQRMDPDQFGGSSFIG